MGSWLGLIPGSKCSTLTWLPESNLDIKWQIFLLLVLINSINTAIHIQSPLGEINSTCSLSPTTDNETAISSYECVCSRIVHVFTGGWPHTWKHEGAGKLCSLKCLVISYYLSKNGPEFVNWKRPEGISFFTPSFQRCDEWEMKWLAPGQTAEDTRPGTWGLLGLSSLVHEKTGQLAFLMLATQNIWVSHSLLLRIVRNM